jgi:hypothetical protein
MIWSTTIYRFFLDTVGITIVDDSETHSFGGVNPPGCY